MPAKGRGLDDEKYHDLHVLVSHSLMMETVVETALGKFYWLFLGMVVLEGCCDGIFLGVVRKSFPQNKIDRLDLGNKPTYDI